MEFLDLVGALGLAPEARIRLAVGATTTESQAPRSRKAK